MLNPTHHYCDVYDSLQQAINLRHAKNVSWDNPLNRYYLGRLRLDTLLARKTIIKDVELLNGIFFLSATESDDIFNNMPLEKIEIRSRSANLEEALVRLFAPPGAENLRGIILQALPFKEADEARKRLETIPSTRVTNRQSLCRVLKEDAEIDRTWVDRLDQAWRQWIDLSASHKLDIAIWKKFDFDAALSKELDRTNKDTFDSLETKLGKGLAKIVYKVGSDRGKVVEYVRKARPANETEQKDIAPVSSWHSAAYNRSVAVHHDCGMVEITDDADSRPIGVIRELFDQILERLRSGTASNIPAANISRAFLEALSRYSKREYDGLIEKHKDNLKAWHNNADNFPRLAQAVNELVEAVDSVEPYKDDRIIPGWFAGPLKVVCRAGAHATHIVDVCDMFNVCGIFANEITKEVIDSGINGVIDTILPGKHASVSRRIVRAGVSRRIVERAT
jgi:hypothetical protein